MSEADRETMKEKAVPAILYALESEGALDALHYWLVLSETPI